MLAVQGEKAKQADIAALSSRLTGDTAALLARYGRQRALTPTATPTPPVTPAAPAAAPTAPIAQELFRGGAANPMLLPLLFADAGNSPLLGRG